MYVFFLFFILIGNKLILEYDDFVQTDSDDDENDGNTGLRPKRGNLHGNCFSKFAYL